MTTATMSITGTSVPAAKKPSKMVNRFYKLVAKIGRHSRRNSITAAPATPTINVCDCNDEIPSLSGPLPISLAKGISRFLNIPEKDDCMSLDSGLGSAPPSPREPVSYPSTPDYVQFSGDESWSTVSQDTAFFPHDSGIFPLDSGKIDLVPHDDIDVRDWAVDYAELEIKAKIQQNATGVIHRGQWHGNVLIYKHSPEHSYEQFMRNVKNMSKTRHENILLFLGAAVDNEEQLAIVVQPPKRQQSLHQLLNNSRLNKLPHNVKFSIAHQLVQAVSYLHAKDVCVGTALHSGNVFVESKIKLSLLDFGFFRPADVMFPMCSSTAVQNYLTSFLAPEMLALSSSINNLNSHSTEATDAFALGSLLYEIFTEEKPFLGLDRHAHLDLLKSEAFSELLDRPDIPSAVQKVISHCWRWNPVERPTFWQISEMLNNKPTFLLSRRSFSQPDLLDVAGSNDAKSLQTF